MRAGAAAEAAGNLASAARACRRAVALSRPLPGRPPTRLYARTLGALGHVLQEQGRYRIAASALRAAVAATERAFGPRSLELSTALNNLGVCYKFLGRLLDAGPIYQRALVIVESRFGPQPAEAATLYHNLGGLEHSAGNWQRGEPFARQAVRIRRRALGARHPLVAHDMTALAALLDQQRKYEEAERLYNRALAIFEREYGPDRPESSVTLNNLAAVHQARNRPKQAEVLYRRALAIDTEHLGPDHPRVGFCANNLAVLLKARGRTAEAADLFRQALRVFTHALGAEHPHVGVCLDNYAAVLKAQGRRREAAAAARRARRILGRIEAVNDAGVAMTATINPMRARYQLVTRSSRIHRVGVFANEPIPADRAVIEYTGERVARGEAKRRWDPKRSYLFEVDSYWQVDGAIGGSGAELINHSCAPNLWSRVIRKRVWYYSLRRIKRGEELTVDYRYDAGLPPMPCSCGSATCRGTMNLPPES